MPGEAVSQAAVTPLHRVGRVWGMFGTVLCRATLECQLMMLDLNIITDTACDGVCTCAALFIVAQRATSVHATCAHKTHKRGITRSEGNYAIERGFSKGEVE